MLKSRPKPNQTLISRLQELNDYGFFGGATSAPGLLDVHRPTLIRIHQSTNEMLQNAFSSFVLYSLYKDMFRRGVQQRLTHAIIFDEAHRAAKLKLIPRFAKECRKYGLAFALASQGVRDFDPALFEAVGSYLILRTTDADAKALARIAASSQDQQRIAGRIKELPPYSAYFFGPGATRSVSVRLAPVGSPPRG
ncbi:hypothetical protein [Rhodobacter capsulatus]|uniref:hypothetical protein n=1 Tax=Rhodobacter capsulatus TaxID=1061 RepID=UPI004029DAAE